MAIKTKNNKPTVFLVCTGLGRISRGYESFTRECFDSLKDVTDYELLLIKGGGESTGKEIVISNLYRQRKSAKWLSKMLGKDAYFIEQLTFCIGMLPLLIKRKPALIYYSDFVLGTFLWQLRRFFKFRYKLLFSNGAPNGPPFTRMDHVQQLLPVHLNAALEAGAPAAMQTLLPYGIKIDVVGRMSLMSSKSEKRRLLGLPEAKKIILCVGALNSTQKRMDYVINEIANLDESYYLVLLGQHDGETPVLIELAKQKLADRVILRTVMHEEVANYYSAADIFVLGSLSEGLPRVLPEALSYGLPCFVHDYPLTRQTLAEYGYYTDMRKDGVLSQQILLLHDTVLQREERIRFAHKTYSWDMLAAKYSTLILKNL